MVYRRRKKFTFHLDSFPKIAFDLSPYTFVFSYLSWTFCHSSAESKVALSANTVGVISSSAAGELVFPSANFFSISGRGASFAVYSRFGPCSSQKRGVTSVGLVKAKLVMVLSIIAFIAVRISSPFAVHFPSPCRYWRTWVMVVGLGKGSSVA